MHNVGCLIVGMGGISAATLPRFERKSWYSTVGVVDVRDEALARAGELTGLPREALFKDLDRALDEVACDAVIVNTPSELHSVQCEAALAAGKHVLVAKPVTNNFQEAVELVELAAEKGLTLCVGQQLRYNRHYMAVARFVAEGRLGSVEAAWFMNSKPRPKAANLAQMDQPALYENSCHHFDSLLAVFEGRMPEWITCDGFIPSWSPYAGPCMVNALIGFSGGLHVAYHGGFSSRAPMYEFRLEGAGGVLCCHGLHMSNDTMDYEFAPALGAFAPEAVDAEVPPVNPWDPFLDAWHDCLAGGVEPPFSGRHNLKVFAMLSAATESIRTTARVTIASNPRFAKAFVD